ncbi:formimidoylglutamate deiminase [Kangiella sediminilitoris]|uniref:N-formimino-L-glutamate deiminase n=1 Tax=Kangiella sediminilitoris TaxID=1144748 RepID=A0A1B3BA42_9GAMM|nr:formimidoylglutamate deiminase [Kangiella sediminilitoris]AOE49682.1 N-formimino-L-glutamate deiminase [Kangiella sediminilitoris]
MTSIHPQQIFAKTALLSDGWQENVLFEHDSNGLITKIKPQTKKPENFSGKCIEGAVIPGMVNNHSHAFQWAMAGLGEASGETKDSFWTWRKAMYGFVEKIDPDDLKNIASALYMQMLKSGYTSVGEFHYLHHDRTGQSYDNPAEMSLQIFEAAKDSGIDVTLLPVFYRYSGFGPQAPNEGQKRFIHSQEAYGRLLEHVHLLASEYNQSYGIAPHSLRAVTLDDIKFATQALRSQSKTAPVHIHIAEQTKEVNDCVAHYGERPVEWLYNHLSPDNRWCLVHATHMTDSEIATVAQSNAVISICTTTEANLGDGFFPMMDYKAQNGRWSVGSDSHISVSSTEELRWLEYQQRLRQLSRTVLVEGAHSSTGEWLWTQAAEGGAQSLQQPVGRIEVGAKANFVELNSDSLVFVGKNRSQLLDAFIFNQADNNAIASVWVGGTKVVENGEHHSEQAITQAFKQSMTELQRA